MLLTNESIIRKYISKVLPHFPSEEVERMKLLQHNVDDGNNEDTSEMKIEIKIKHYKD